MKVLQTSSFKKTVKKLYSNQKIHLDKAIENVINNPLIGVQKTGDLSGIRVHKFDMINQQALLAYQFTEGSQETTLILLALGTHENSYRELKTKI